MGLFSSWLKKTPEEPAEPESEVKEIVGAGTKMFEGIPFPVEVDVVIEPRTVRGKNKWRWHYLWNHYRQEGDEDTQRAALKAASKDAWMRINRKRAQDQHLAQGSVKI